MAHLFIIGLFKTLFLLLILLFKKNKQQADLFLGLLITSYAICIGVGFLEQYNISNNFPFPFFLNISWLFLFLHGPFLFLYSSFLIKQKKCFSFKELIHFAPFFIFLILQLILFSLKPVPDKILIVTLEQFRENFIFRLGMFIASFSAFLYCLYSLSLIRKYQKQVLNEYANTEGIDLNWLKLLVTGSLIVYSIGLTLINVNNFFHFASYYQIAAFGYTMAIIFIVTIGFYGIRHSGIFIELCYNTLGQTERALNSKKKEYDLALRYQCIIESLENKMNETKPYLDSELNLQKLSSASGIKKELLSEALNSSIQQNFFEYINSYRIEEFKRRCALNNSKKLSILGLAYDCGFNSKTAFYRAFNKFEGMSPTAYIKTVERNK